MSIDSSIAMPHGTALSPQTGPSDTPDRRPVGHQLLLADLSWENYRRISEAFTGLPVRIAYDRGRLELMVISFLHEGGAYFLARCVYVLTEQTNTPVASAGSMTLEREDLDRSIEPDKCFYLEHEPLVRGKKSVKLPKDPPPNLAVESEVSRRAIKHLPIYEALGVPEVWRTDGDSVTFHVLQPDGKYVVVERSRNFPFLRSTDLLPFLSRRGNVEENSLLREFRAWVRQQLNQQKPS
jgi:Uma2 family endonuclease